MQPDSAPVLEAVARRHLRLVARPLRVLDVALFYGERSGGIRSYLDAKARFAASTTAFEHHLVVPGKRRETSTLGGATVHAVPSVVFNSANGYRLPLGHDDLMELIAALAPDVALLHDPFWHTREVCRAVRRAGGVSVMVDHGSTALDTPAWPGPERLYARAFRRWLRHASAEADAVMSACDRPATLRLRSGVHPAFTPTVGVPREDHVLYVGRLAREKGIFTLLEAAARSSEPWRLRMIGSGPAEQQLRAQARRLGITDRLELRPYLSDRHALAHEYARAHCAVLPGHLETFGLVALEAAACGTPVVACETAPSAAVIGSRCRTFAPRDAGALARAITAARADEPDRCAALALSAIHSWDSVLSAELDDLRELARR